MSETEKEIWTKTAELLGLSSISLSNHWSYNYRNDPKRFGFVLSRYKFSAKMGCKQRSVLELGCGEGIGAPILAENASHYTGVDLDEVAIDTARQNLPHEKYTFHHADIMGRVFGTFQMVVSLDVVEHIYPEFENVYFSTICSNLSHDGIAIIGTPNATSAAYASKASQLGHVNLFTQERLKKTLEHYFHTVFPFGMNDEVMHTGYAPMAHYLICVACHRRENV